MSIRTTSITHGNEIISRHNLLTFIGTELQDFSLPSNASGILDMIVQDNKNSVVWYRRYAWTTYSTFDSFYLEVGIIYTLGTPIIDVLPFGGSTTAWHCSASPSPSTVKVETRLHIYNTGSL